MILARQNTKGVRGKVVEQNKEERRNELTCKSNNEHVNYVKVYRLFPKLILTRFTGQL